jgi:hypothetical protein
MLLTLKFVRLNYLVVNIIILTAETWEHGLWRTESRCYTQIIRGLIKSSIPAVYCLREEKQSVTKRRLFSTDVHSSVISSVRMDPYSVRTSS